jgi:hypothetical protein
VKLKSIITRLLKEGKPIPKREVIVPDINSEIKKLENMISSEGESIWLI